MPESNTPLPPQVADAYVDELIALDPVTGTYLGVPESSRTLPDYSPAGQEALAELARTTLAKLDEAERGPGADSDVERRCGRLLRERLTAELAVHEAQEHLRAVGNMHTPGHSVRDIFTVMPAETEEDWAAIAEEAARLGEERIVVNMGPQHPSTHGVLRLMLEIDGETVTEARAGIGYLHTGIEKNMEFRTWTQGVTYCTRMDYLAPFFNEATYCLGVERLLRRHSDVLQRVLRWLQCVAQTRIEGLVQLGREASRLHPLEQVEAEIQVTRVLPVEVEERLRSRPRASRPWGFLVQRFLNALIEPVERFT